MRIHILELLLWLCISVTCKLYETTQMVCVCHLSLKIRIPSDSSAEEIMNRRACNDAVCGGVSSAPLICLSSHVSLLITRSWGCWRRCWGSVTGSTLRASWIRCQLSTPPPTRPSPSHCANCSTWSWSRSTAGTAFRRALSWACNSVRCWFMYVHGQLLSQWVFLFLGYVWLEMNGEPLKGPINTQNCKCEPMDCQEANVHFKNLIN